MLWKGGACRLGRFVFLFTSMPACSFSPTSEFTGSSIKAKCEPVKKYKWACEKHTSEPVKSPYGGGRYCDMTVSPTRSHLLCFLWIRCEMRWTSRSFFKFSGKYLLINCSMLESKTRFGVLEVITFRHIGHVVGFIFLFTIQAWIPTLWTVNEVLDRIDILGIDIDIHPFFE